MEAEDFRIVPVMDITILKYKVQQKCITIKYRHKWFKKIKIGEKVEWQTMGNWVSGFEFSHFTAFLFDTLEEAQQYIDNVLFVESQKVN